MRCAIWYHLCNSKNVKNTHGEVLLLEKLQAKSLNFTKSSTTLWVFFKFLKLYKWYQIAQNIILFCSDSKVQMLFGRITIRFNKLKTTMLLFKSE